MPLTQNPLTVLVPIKPANVRVLKNFLTEQRDRINSYFQKSPSTHFARWVILEDRSIEVNHPHLLFTSNYDGSFESYLQELVTTMGQEMEHIWKHCQDYASGTSQNIKAFIEFIQQHSYKSQAFYVACPGVMAETILNSSQISEKIDRILDEKKLRLELSNLFTLVSGRSPEPATSSALTSKESNHLEPLVTRVLPLLTKVSKRVAKSLESFVGIRRGVNNLAEPMRELNQDQQARVKELEKIEDRITQNQMTTLSAIKSDFHSKILLKVILRLIDLVAQKSWGNLAGISTIHFARWVIIDQGKISNSNKSYLLFESNYNQSWDSYIDDFADRPTPMNLIFGNLENFPTCGCQDIERFKQQIREHQFPSQFFYSAYPHLAVKNILSDLQISNTTAQFLQQEEVKQFLSGSYQASLTVRDHPLVQLVKSL